MRQMTDRALRKPKPSSPLYSIQRKQDKTAFKAFLEHGAKNSLMRS